MQFACKAFRCIPIKRAPLLTLSIRTRETYTGRERRDRIATIQKERRKAAFKLRNKVLLHRIGQIAASGFLIIIIFLVFRSSYNKQMSLTEEEERELMLEWIKENEEKARIRK